MDVPVWLLAGPAGNDQRVRRSYVGSLETLSVCPAALREPATPSSISITTTHFIRNIGNALKSPK